MVYSRFLYLALCSLCAVWVMVGCGDDDTEDTEEENTDNNLDGGTSNTGGGTDVGGNTDGSGGSEDVAASLVGITFISTSVTENGAPKTLAPSTKLQLQFQDDGNVSAHAGCNSMFGTYAVTDGILTVGQMGMTEMGCDQDRHAQDQWFSEFLQSSPTLSLVGDTLTLGSESAGVVTEIVFMDEEVATPDLALTDTTWVVDTIIDGSAASNMQWASPATFTFGVDGMLQFFTGCNDGSANYVVDGNQITLSDASWTEAGCPDEASQSLETAVLNVVSAQEPITWEIDVDRLSLNATSAGLGFAAE